MMWEEARCANCNEIVRFAPHYAGWIHVRDNSVLCFYGGYADPEFPQVRII